MSYRIVIAEDEFFLATHIKSLVESLSHEVVGMAKTGTEAVALVNQQQPDLVLMDIQIPEMDGIAAAGEIVRNYAIPSIIITAHSDTRYVEGAVEAGVMTYLLKPVVIGELQAAIDLTMARFRDLQLLRQEVDELKKTLVERKIVERAKGILMDRLHITENEAFRRLQQQSQRENRPMIEIARGVISAASLLSEGG